MLNSGPIEKDDEAKRKDYQAALEILDRINKMKAEATKKAEQLETESRERELALERQEQELRERSIRESQKRQDAIEQLKRENEQRELKVQSDLKKYKEGLNQPAEKFETLFPDVHRVFGNSRNAPMETPLINQEQSPVSRIFGNSGLTSVEQRQNSYTRIFGNSELVSSGTKRSRKDDSHEGAQISGEKRRKQEPK